MAYILEELKLGNIEILSTMTNEDIHYTAKLIDGSQNKNELLHTILPYFENKGYYYGIAHDLFHLIYLESEFKANTFYLLHKEYVTPEELSIEEINNILNNTSWGLEYVYHNLERILSKDDIYRMIGNIIEKIKNKPEIYQKFLEKVLTISNEEIRDKFIVSSIRKHISFDIKNIIKTFYKNPDEFDYQQECLPFYHEPSKLIFSELPKFLLFYSKHHPDIKKMIMDNFEIFFQVESQEKMGLLDDFYTESLFLYQHKDLLYHYKELLYLYQKQKALDVDQMLTILVNYHQENLITELLKNHNVKYLTSGSTTRVFQVGNKVLKFSLEKYEFDTEKDFFLIAPTETKVIYDKNQKPILIIEIQDYLDKKYCGIAMTDEDIDHFFMELDNQGYMVTDPNCLEKNFTNFGFLNDYHDANITGLESAEDLPEWFKKRPIVLYDVDLIYKKDAVHVKRF